VYEELGGQGFVPITVALDRGEDARPFIERAKPTHPSLIDEAHVVAERYHFVNVPSIVWIDAAGRICRPVDNQFGTDTFTRFTGKRSGPYLDLIRAWVQRGEGVIGADEARRLTPLPTAEAQLARAERALAWHLHQAGRSDAAGRHFARAGELAPADWTIRRGSMPLRGQNPFGPDFFALAKEGRPELPMEAVTPTKVG
jgi:hypothetical protein